MKKIIPHIAIILTAMIITLIVLNYLNPLMGFLSRDISKIVITLWALSVITCIITFIFTIIKKNKTSGDQL